MRGGIHGALLQKIPQSLGINSKMCQLRNSPPIPFATPIDTSEEMGKRRLTDKESDLSDFSDIDSIDSDDYDAKGTLHEAGAGWSASQLTTVMAALTRFAEANHKKVKVGQLPALLDDLVATRWAKFELEKWSWDVRHVRDRGEFLDEVEEFVKFFVGASIDVDGIRNMVGCFPDGCKEYLSRKYLASQPKGGSSGKSNKKLKKSYEGRREKDPRGHAEKMVNNFRIAVTGAREGETIVGFQGIAGGNQMVVVGQDIPPILQDVETIHSQPDLWTRFLTKLGQDIEFFRNMPDNSARGAWVLAHAEPEENLHMSDMTGLHFRILHLGNNENMSKLNEMGKTLLMSRETPISAKDFAKMIPAKLGSTSEHHTLFFGRNYWKVLDRDPMIDSIDKETLVINLSRREIPAIAYGPLKRRDDEELVRVLMISDRSASGAGNIACLFNARGGVSLDVPSLAGRLGIPESITNRWLHAVRSLTAGALKSFLQKVIRFRPATVDVGDAQSPLPASDALTLCFLQLLSHPGGFVPDIQRFVSGIESAVKRLAIIAFEDSYPFDLRTLAELSCAAFISQRYKTWRPSFEQIKRWVHFAIRLYVDNRAVVYNVDRGAKAPPITIREAANKPDNPLYATSALMDVVRSFAGDLSMIRDITLQTPFKWPIKFCAPESPVGIMSFHHCVDQHWAADVAYLFYPLELTYNMCRKASRMGTPFAPLLGRLFAEVTGINPRRVVHDAEKFETEDFVICARRAQKAYLAGIQCKDRKMREVVDGEVVTINAELEDAWLAGMIGTVEVRKGKMLAALVPDNLGKVIVAKRPSTRAVAKGGDAKAGSALGAAGLTEDKETNAGEEEFWGMLGSNEGIPLNAIPVPPLPALRGATVRFDGDDFLVRLKDGRELPWSEARKATTQLPVLISPVLHEADAETYDYIHDFMEFDGVGVCRNAWEILQHVVKKMIRQFPGGVRRAISYLSKNEPEFDVNRLGREGGGTDAAVTADDAGAFHVLAIMACLYPGVLGRVQGRPVRFVVRSAPKVWELRAAIESLLLSEENRLTGKQGLAWNADSLGDEKRSLLGYQEETTGELSSAHAAGRRGHFLWLPPGAGKTKIVCEFLTRLAKEKQLPPYVVYALPKESMETIMAELGMYGFRVRVLAGFSASAKRYSQEPAGKKLVVDYPADTKPASVPSVLGKRGGSEIGRGLRHQGWIHIVEHDHLRVLVSDALLPTASDTLSIIDEVHLAMADTLRTAATQALADASREFIALTGTPIVDSNLYRLVPWLRHLVPFTVTEKNFWCAATNMVARKVETGIPRLYERPLAPMTEKEKQDWDKLMPPRLGGRNKNCGTREFILAAEASYEMATREIIRQTERLLKTRRGVMIVAKDSKHAERIFDAIALPKKQKLLMTGPVSANLTPTSNPSNIRAVVVPYRRATGYTLTALDTMIWTVYPSNQALRTQLEARIDRVGQVAEELLYVKVMTPLFAVMEEKHAAAKTLEDALKAMVRNIDASDGPKE
ncbi:hypothetical protein HK104_005177 [Borealophlyctis nickersoniae]|nr:hypothetical protein HK104_005177 [Borealophlyctis nickersoniae]